MISHGMWSTYNYIQKHYDPNRSDKVITGLFHKLKSIYIRYYVEQYGAHKRGWMAVEVEVTAPNKKGKMVTKKETKYVSVTHKSLQAMQEQINGTVDDVVGNIPSLYTDENHIIDAVMTECFVVPALTKVYRKASPKLQQAIVDWFWYTKDKVHTKSPKFKEMSKEFRMLCSVEDVECDDCLHLVHSPNCLNRLSHSIFAIPWDPTCTPIVGKDFQSKLVN